MNEELLEFFLLFIAHIIDADLGARAILDRLIACYVRRSELRERKATRWAIIGIRRFSFDQLVGDSQQFNWNS